MIDIGPAAQADIEALGPPFPFRVQALAARTDGRTIGVAGIGFRDNGEILLWARLTDELRKRPVLLHKAALRFIDEFIRRPGLRQVVAIADADIPAAPRWLERLGFKPIGERMYVWRSDINVGL